jgi:hypothetical protein
MTAHWFSGPVRRPQFEAVSGTAGDFSANGTSAILYLPGGQYRFSVATATAVYASVVAIPNDA